MYKRIVVLLAAVIVLALGAGISLAADNALLYGYRGGAGAANYFPPTAGATSFGVNAGYGANWVDGALTGVAAGNPTNVFLNNGGGGLGDALIYGYFNVRDGGINVFQVVNNATYGVRARIRFLDARCSRDILDFDVCLSPRDVFTGLLMQDPADAAAPTRLFGFENDGNAPDTPIDYGAVRGARNGIPEVVFPDGIPFKTVASGSCGTVTAADTQEGYFVVIAENRLAVGAAGAVCGTVGGTQDPLRTQTLRDDLVTVPPCAEAAGAVCNVLSGQTFIVNGTGETFAYSAIALADFTNIPLVFNPTDARPNLADAAVPAGQTGQNQGTTGAIGAGLANVNFILTKNMLIAPYWLYDGALESDVIVNFATRELTIISGAANDVFDDDRVTITAFNDEEYNAVTVCEFSPCGVGVDVDLPNEVNVVRINSAAIFNTNVATNVTLAQPSFTKGFLMIDLVNANATPTVAGPLPHNHVIVRGATTFTANGLPAIGFTATSIPGSPVNWMLPLNYTQDVLATP